jgi:rhamnosyl/mannosyltransferase
LIAGEGGLREELERKAKSLGVEHKIIFVGKVSDDELKYCYQICDLFVLPSVEPSEAFGIVQMEAMAYGKPVVNTNLPTGVPYVSVDGETGITVPPRDSKALADAINRILNDNELAAKFSKNALKRVKEKFSREKMLESIYSIYEDLM